MACTQEIKKPGANTSLIKGTKKLTQFNILVDIFQMIKAIFTDLFSNDLLPKRLHDQTQDTNEALNAIIWTHCPKLELCNFKF